MLRKKDKKKSDNSTRASVKKEMAKPRITKSARIAERRLDTARIPEQSSTTLPGTVDKIIPASHSSKSERAQIPVEGADLPHRDLRIENILTDENGDDVRLKKGAHVEVTVSAEPEKSTIAIKDSI
jgi:serine/threonine protein kinase